jgi:hypothetical protein
MIDKPRKKGVSVRVSVGLPASREWAQSGLGVRVALPGSECRQAFRRANG